MKANIISPTLAKITFDNSVELDSVKKYLTYKNTSVAFQLSKHNKNRWWKQRDPIGWGEREVELKKEMFTCMLTKSKGDYVLRPGILPYLKNITDVNITNNVLYPDYKALPWAQAPDFEPYPYQAKSVEGLMEIKHGNIEIPTGAGKSLVLLMLAKKIGLNTVVVTPSKSIFNELLKEFQLRLGKKYVGGYGDGKKDISKKITIAIGKSLTMLKPGTKAYDFFSTKEAMLVDECHTFAANQLEKVCHGILENVPYRMFVSATQTRGDGTEKLLEAIIGKSVLKMDLDQAIADGYLCPLEFNIIKTYSRSSLNKKDPLECKRHHLLYNEEVAKIAAKIANSSAKIKNESTLILVEELRQIEMLTKLLKVPYAYVHSGSASDAAAWNLQTVKLQDEVDDFNEGKVKVLIGTRAIATGTNIYPTHNVINWVGGSSEIVTKQGAMGRATRKLEISKYKDKHVPKPFSKIFDFKIVNEPILDRHLNSRIQFYKESGGAIKFL